MQEFNVGDTVMFKPDPYSLEGVCGKPGVITRKEIRVDPYCGDGWYYYVFIPEAPPALLLDTVLLEWRTTGHDLAKVESV